MVRSFFFWISAAVSFIDIFQGTDALNAAQQAQRDKQTKARMKRAAEVKTNQEKKKRNADAEMGYGMKRFGVNNFDELPTKSADGSPLGRNAFVTLITQGGCIDDRGSFGNSIALLFYFYFVFTRFNFFNFLNFFIRLHRRIICPCRVNSEDQNKTKDNRGDDFGCSKSKGHR